MNFHGSTYCSGTKLKLGVQPQGGDLTGPTLNVGDTGPIHTGSAATSSCLPLVYSSLVSALDASEMAAEHWVTILLPINLDQSHTAHLWRKSKGLHSSTIFQILNSLNQLLLSNVVSLPPPSPPQFSPFPKTQGGIYCHSWKIIGTHWFFSFLTITILLDRHLAKEVFS